MNSKAVVGVDICFELSFHTECLSCSKRTSTRLSARHGRHIEASGAVHLCSRHSLPSYSSRSQSCLISPVWPAAVVSLVRVAAGHVTLGSNVCLCRTSSKRERRRHRRRFRLRLSPIVFTLTSEDFHTSPVGAGRAIYASDYQSEFGIHTVETGFLPSNLPAAVNPRISFTLPFLPAFWAPMMRRVTATTHARARSAHTRAPLSSSPSAGLDSSASWSSSLVAPAVCVAM